MSFLCSSAFFCVLTASLSACDDSAAGGAAEAPMMGGEVPELVDGAEVGLDTADGRKSWVSLAELFEAALKLSSLHHPPLAEQLTVLARGSWDAHFDKENHFLQAGNTNGPRACVGAQSTSWIEV
ncbi:unnamed protein product [Phytophthora fragariaefolia]|uniref:Unnamed protein product n=1 Tax=Phytophthora fragariaefolia TaxID=1490495 RepID=A0A9W7CUK0_9STRA|nr:unnamed protein product [Phytophthora fragariaefolia]